MRMELRRNENSPYSWLFKLNFKCFTLTHVYVAKNMSHYHRVRWRKLMEIIFVQKEKLSFSCHNVVGVIFLFVAKFSSLAVVR